MEDKMNQFESIRRFSDQYFFLLVGALLLFLFVAGARRKSDGRGTGRYATAWETLSHLGNWARFPLSLYAVMASGACLSAIIFGWRFSREDLSAWMHPDQTVIILTVSLIVALLLYWILLERFFIRRDKNRFILGTKRFFLPVTLSLPEKDRFEHIRVQGRAGTGKTDGYMFPQLIEDASGDCSAVVLDVKSPEVFEAIGGAWCAKEKKVILFDPYHPDCPGFELLASTTGLDRIEEVVLGKRNTDANDTSIWFDLQERRLFRLMCQLVMGYKDPRQCCLPMVYQLALRGVLALEAAVTYCQDPLLQAEFEHQFQNKLRLPDILSGILNKLDLFSDPKIAAAFSRPDLDLDLLFREPILLIIASPHSNPKARLAASLLLRAIMMRVYDHPVRTKEDGLPLFFYLDEFYALHLPDLADFANTARSARVGIVTYLQAEEQLTRYQPHEVVSIAVNTKTEVALQGCDLPSCKRLSELYGKCLIRDKRIARSWRRGSVTTTAYIEKPLLTVDEIHNMPLGTALLNIGGLHPVWAKLVSSYKTRRFKRRRGLPVEAYRPVMQPLTPPSYRDLDLPGGDPLPPSPSSSTPPGPPRGGEIVGW
jgi:type IV secretory pathway TraG/TraD family ATPase VirD4